ncbi:glycosyltransferase [Terrabacter sp. BE26]|uniref:glycosyltransferase n=1 Tax=Terrabacter sp. BE26 TaxID=2898152 RepID=UPI0035BE8091
MTDALSHDSRPQGGRSSGTGDRTRGETAHGSTSDAGSAALRIAIVGPAHLDEETAAGHTAMLAHHLSDAGHEVTLVTWTAPSRSRSSATAAAEHLDVAPFPRTIRALSRTRPDTWVRAGRRLRDVDAVLVVQPLPTSVPAHRALLQAAGAVRAGPLPPGAGPRPQSVVVCLDALPGSMRPVQGRLVSSLLSRVDSVLVHTAGQAAAARGLGAHHVSVAGLPPLPAGGDGAARGSRREPTRLLALEAAGRLDGLEVLLRAMRSVPDVSLTIAGELRGADAARVGRLAADPALGGRVEVKADPLPADGLAALLGAHDVLALPYLSAPSTREVALGHLHGLPVLAFDVPPFSAQVTDGLDGLLVPSDDEHALTGGLRRLGDPSVRRRLAEGVQTPDLEASWAHYLGTIETLSAPDRLAAAGPHDGGGDEHAGHAGRGFGRTVSRAGQVAVPGARLVVDRLIGSITGREGTDVAGRASGTVARLVRQASSHVLAGRRPLVTLQPGDLPDWVRATDVLGEAEQADDARRLSRILGLPRSLDDVAAWAALGALAAILRVRDDGLRSSVIVDEGGTRSVLSRWARAVGFAPVAIDFTGKHPSVAALDVDTGSLDVIVRIHPHGCDGEDVDHVLEQASWALGSGGLLVITVPIGPRAAEGAVGPADVRAILARAHGLGFVLVGDLDGDVTARMRRAASRARADDAAYGLVRLTLRRR